MELSRLFGQNEVFNKYFKFLLLYIFFLLTAGSEVNIDLVPTQKYFSLNVLISPHGSNCDASKLKIYQVLQASIISLNIFLILHFSRPSFTLSIHTYKMSSKLPYLASWKEAFEMLGSVSHICINVFNTKDQ
jgi:hypothetical protein